MLGRILFLVGFYVNSFLYEFAFPLIFGVNTIARLLFIIIIDIFYKADVFDKMHFILTQVL